MDTVVAGILVALVVLLLAAIQPWLVSLAVRLLKPQTGAGLADVSWGDLVNAAVATISAITGAVGVLGLGSRLRGSRAILTTTLLAAAVAALLYAIVLAAAALMVLGTAANGGAWQAATIMGFGSAAVAAFVLGGYISPNATSLHGFYRRRLADAFIGTAPPPRLSGLMPALTGGPFPIVNATVNGVVDGGEERRGRTTCGFTMTPLRVGNGSLEYCETMTAEKDDPRFDAASAMALSGAAMGGNQSGTGLGARLLRGVFNLRTARWMTNPARLRHGVPPAWSYWKPRWLLLEWFGIRRISRDSRYILVSDGGHHENLGINALIHRGCDIIIVVDAEADKEMTFNGLAVATRLARLDAEGTEIDIVPAALGHEKEKGCVRAHFCQGDIRYGGTIAARSAGGSARLIYVKASVSGDEPLDILEYRTRNPDFPHETTADQFFSEEQFESYRSLGEHIGMNVLAQSALLQRLAASYSSPSSA
ncbi:MAG: hypothetical protein K2X46_08545, partial [Roseomonas sp.]|nr:hypothetical protein [Roseomonas sp.]